MSNLITTTKDIQRHYGLEVDGIYGPVTAAAVWNGINREAGEAAQTQVLPDAPAVGGWQNGLDGRTVANIQTLDPKVRDNYGKYMRLAKATAATVGCDYVLISGDRTWEEQDEMYAQGRTKPGNRVTKARGGSSNHKFKVAGDAGVFRGKAYLDNSDRKMAAKVHKMCSVHAKACGLDWGGSWKSFTDLPHYEFPTGLSMKAKRKKFSKEGSIV